MGGSCSPSRGPSAVLQVFGGLTPVTPLAFTPPVFPPPPCTAEGTSACGVQTFPRVEFVHSGLRSARRRLMDLSFLVFISTRPHLIFTTTLGQAGQVTSLLGAPETETPPLLFCINNLPSAASQSRMSHRCDCYRDDTRQDGQDGYEEIEHRSHTPPTHTHLPQYMLISR